MKNRKRTIRIGILFLAAAAFLSYPAAVMANALKEARQEQKALEDSLKETRELIDSLQDSKQDIAGKVTELDARLTEISADISNLQSSLEEKNIEISDTKSALEQAKEDEREQYESMKRRIQFIYENSRSSVMERILSAKSFADFLNIVEYASQISQYDRAMLDKYQETQKTVKRTGESLEAGKAELEEMQAKVKEEQQALQALLAAKETELAKVDESLSQADGQKDFYEAELAAQNEIIEQIIQAEAAKQAARQAAKEARRAAEEARRAAEEQAKAQEAEQDGEESSQEPTEAAPDDTPDDVFPLPEDDTYTGGAFLWPCPSSRRVTSDYGNRISPTAGASSNHKGVDIGASYGADIVAAADGTVIFAGYSSSAGNYLMIDHGGSLYTVYMHASSLCAGQGEAVTRGQVVAKVGSTGISTGNHLHFGVSLNGSYVSPWNYLSQ